MTEKRIDQTRMLRRGKESDFVSHHCPMSWDQMGWDDRRRFCGECQRQVWNFHEMTEGEIAEIRRTNPERLCVQITDVKETTQTPFRFSILVMMIFVTILAPLVFFSPAFFRWCWPVEQPPPPGEPEIFITQIHDLKDRIMAKSRDLQADAQVEFLGGKNSRSED
ncbi:MAG: hypothetical protein JNK57_06875 [Planctomycetaceae bacterium]|nr:hypothetical protein [Planctomycetaceae bacterium]